MNYRGGHEKGCRKLRATESMRTQTLGPVTITTDIRGARRSGRTTKLAQHVIDFVEKPNKVVVVTGGMSTQTNLILETIWAKIDHLRVHSKKPGRIELCNGSVIMGYPTTPGQGIASRINMVAIDNSDYLTEKQRDEIMPLRAGCEQVIETTEDREATLRNHPELGPNYLTR